MLLIALSHINVWARSESTASQVAFAVEDRKADADLRQWRSRFPSRPSVLELR